MLRENKCWQPTSPIICHKDFWESHCANGNLLLHRCHWKLLYRPGAKSHKPWDNAYEYCMSSQNLHSFFMFAFDVGWAMNCQPRKAWMVRIVLLQSWMSPEAPSLASMTLRKGLGIISEIPSWLWPKKNSRIVWTFASIWKMNRVQNGMWRNVVLDLRRHPTFNFA